MMNIMERGIYEYARFNGKFLVKSNVRPLQQSFTMSIEKLTLEVAELFLPRLEIGVAIHVKILMGTSNP